MQQSSVLARLLPVMAVIGAAAGVYLTLTFQGGQFTQLALMLIGGCFGVVLARRLQPTTSVCMLVAWLPFQLFTLSYLYKLGVPGAVVRPLGAIREILVLGVVSHAISAKRREVDTTDRLAFTYLGICTVYLMFPTLFDVPGGPYDSGPAVALNVRLLAYRADTLFIILFLAVRRIPFSEAQRRQLMGATVAAISVVAALAVYEYLRPDRWEQLVVEDIAVPTYQRDVLGDRFTARDSLVYAQAGAEEVIRGGSTLLSPLSLGFLLVAGIGQVTAIVAARTRPLVVVGATLMAIALITSYTRSAITGGVIALLLAARPPPTLSALRSMRARIMLVLLLSAMIPLAFSTGVAERIQSAFGGEDSSTEAHGDSLDAGIATLRDRPLGLGLGRVAGQGIRFGVDNVVVAENTYIQVGNELGIPAMLAFTGLHISLLVRLTALRRGRPDVISTAAFASFAGLCVTGLFLHVWLDLVAAVACWASVGVALSHVPRDEDSRDEDLVSSAPALT